VAVVFRLHFPLFLVAYNRSPQIEIYFDVVNHIPNEYSIIDANHYTSSFFVYILTSPYVFCSSHSLFPTALRHCDDYDDYDSIS
jgi:hypothetical protein